MGKYIIKPSVIEAVTFEEFIQIGMENSTNIVNGMPWSFMYHGRQVSHSNDECYLVQTINGLQEFTPNHMLIILSNGYCLPVDKETFYKTYQEVV